jgi:hypothetical protein
MPPPLKVAADPVARLNRHLSEARLPSTRRHVTGPSAVKGATGPAPSGSPFVRTYPDVAWRLIFHDAQTEERGRAAYRTLGYGVKGAVAALIRAAAPPAMLAGPDADERIDTFAQLLTSSQTGLAFWWYENRHAIRVR